MSELRPEVSLLSFQSSCLRVRREGSWPICTSFHQFLILVGFKCYPDLSQLTSSSWAIANNFWVNAAENDQSKARYGKKDVKVINSRLTLSSHWGDWLLHTPKFWKSKTKQQNRKQTNPLPQAHLYHFKTAFSGILIVSMLIHQINNPMSVLYLLQSYSGEEAGNSC